ncbi:MAG: SEL1-like repeat protein [Candidatus Thiodubiliella endoseptemdiera]|uniref:SEL1-like repeat protein n=1 Tax=Candidatus Thiodubiliella endoseptemdiera TaxID=2738886 RepID=A0A853EZM0_9GAMM|nr:SEL1-like repeat protein [Candidatus Thiodubiliella endoseptemdiera]
MKKLLILLLSLSLSFATQADFLAGMKYYKQGDFDSAFQEWMPLAREGNHAISQYNIAQMYRLGKGVEQDNQEALKWFRKAANQGVSIAQERINTLQAEVAVSIAQKESNLLQVGVNSTKLKIAPYDWLEEERLAQIKANKVKQERLAQIEAERVEQEKLAQEEKDKQIETFA